MKNAFSIPVSTSEQLPLYLLVELGSYGISLMWISREPFVVKGLLVFHFEPGESIDSLLTEVWKNPEVNGVKTLGITFCYNYKESVIVPNQYYQSSLSEEMLRLIYGEPDGATAKEDAIAGLPMHNVYRVPGAAEYFIKNHLPSHTASVHATSLQLQEKVDGNRMLCTVFHNCIKIILHIDGKMQLVQQYNYTSPDDVAYHLLNTCQQHQIKPQQMELVLNGMIDPESQLYRRLYTYFPEVRFESVPKEVLQQQELLSLPGHFFSHLTAMASCVS